MESAAPSHPRSGREDGLPAPWFLHVPGSTPALRSLTGVGGGRAAKPKSLVPPCKGWKVGVYLWYFLSRYLGRSLR